MKRFKMGAKDKKRDGCKEKRESFGVEREGNHEMKSENASRAIYSPLVRTQYCNRLSFSVINYN